MSERLSTDLPRACSGERYCAVPITAEVCVCTEEESSTARAMPKSMTLTSPVLVTMMLAGLMSRWIMPASWLACSALATGPSRAAARWGARGPSSRMMSRRLRPVSRSITMKGTSTPSTASAPVS